MNYVIDEIKSLVSVDIQEIAFNAAHPVGEIYIQFPGKEDPQTLYGRGSWSNISNEFAGLFFRAEGGNANVFGGGSQEDKIRNITGGIIYCLDNGTPSGAFYDVSASDYGTGAGRGGRPLRFDANKGATTNNPMAGHADGPEIRPVNTTIRIWQRTA